MEKLDYYRKRFRGFYNFIADNQREESRKIAEEQCERIEKAIKEDNMRFLKAMDKELTVGINEYPKDYRVRINEYIAKELGYDPQPEIERQKVLRKILKRGLIKNRDEYELVHSRVDELAPEAQSDKKAMKEFETLDRLLGEYRE